MPNDKLRNILLIGETISVEFKRCGNGVSADTYETVCSFLNRFGGDIYLGVENNSEVIGLPPKAVPDIIKNFIKTVSNPDIISPTVYLSPEILEYEEKQIIHIHIPPSSEVHTCKKIIYDRVDDSDVKVTATSQVAQMYIRKKKYILRRRFIHISPMSICGLICSLASVKWQLTAFKTTHGKIFLIRHFCKVQVLSERTWKQAKRGTI